jgi:hypothetical protein
MNHFPKEHPLNGSEPHPEALDDGFDAQDRHFDELLSSSLGDDIQVPVGLCDRIFSASLEGLQAGPRPLPFQTPRRSFPMQWIGLAACVGFLMVAGFWMLSVDGVQRQDRMSDLARVASDPAPRMETERASAQLLSSEAEMMLMAMSDERDTFGTLSPYITTRSLRYDDFSGDLVAVLDAMQNPAMQTYDLEWRQ